jgi:hypothetical protein
MRTGGFRTKFYGSGLSHLPGIIQQGRNGRDDLSNREGFLDKDAVGDSLSTPIARTVGGRVNDRESRHQFARITRYCPTISAFAEANIRDSRGPERLTFSTE